MEECMQMMAEHTQMMAEHRWMVECTQMTVKHRGMVTDLYGRDSERTLIIQNMFRGDIGSTEPCWRYHRHYGSVLEVT
jgi:hypothetical protein